LVDRIIFRLLFENGKFGDFSYWKEFQHPHLTDKNFAPASWNARLIIINPSILSDMIIVQKECQSDRLWSAWREIQMIVGEKSNQGYSPCRTTRPRHCLCTRSFPVMVAG
jgi:hypothetical protein